MKREEKFEDTEGVSEYTNNCTSVINQWTDITIAKRKRRKE
jgi:hypothetical protein